MRPLSSEATADSPLTASGRLALLGVLILGAGLRSYRLDVGLPEDVYVDAFKFVDEALRIRQTSDWRATDFQYPRFFVHILATIYGVFGVQTTYAAHLIANGVAAISGTGSILLGYLLARGFLNNGASTLVALLIAICPVSVIQSRTPAPDALMTFLMLGALVVALGSTRRRFAAGRAGVLLGLAISTKFTAIVLAPVLAAAVLSGLMDASDQSSWRRRLGVLCAGVASTVATLFLSTPQLLWDLGPFYERFVIESKLQRAGQIGRIQASALDYLFSKTPTWEMPWLSTSIVGNYGWPLLIAAILGPLILLRSVRFVDRRRQSFLLIVYLALLVGTFFGAGRIKAVRFLVPMLPVVFVLALVSSQELWNRLPWRRERSADKLGIRATLFVLACVILFCLTPARRSISYLVAISRPMTQDLARQWIGENMPRPGPPVSALLSPFFVDSLSVSELAVRSLQNVGARQYRLPPEVGQSPERDPIYSAELVEAARAAGIEVIITNSYFDDAFLPVPENLLYFPISVAKYQEYQRALERSATKVFSVLGAREGRYGPDIHIFRLHPMPAPATP